MNERLTPARTYNFWRPNEDGTARASNYRRNFRLNGVGRDVWGLLDGIHDINSIADSLSAKYKVEASRVKEDVVDLVRFLHAEGLAIADYDPLYKLGRTNDRVRTNLAQLVVCTDGSDSRRLDALIIVPPTPKFETIVLRRLHEFPPVGPMYLAASAAQSGLRVGVLDLWSQIVTASQIDELFRDLSPAVLGFSVMTENYLNGIRMATIARAVFPDTPIVFGGPHASLMPERVLQEQPVDVCFVSESERTFCEYLRHAKEGSDRWHDVPGIVFKINKKVINNGHPGYIADLDSLPRPLFGPSAAGSNRYAVVSSARGCPFACKFCSAGKLSGNTYRFRSPSNVVEELERLVASGVASAGFVDDTITVVPKRIRQICEMIISRQVSIRWSAESRVDFASKHPEILRQMADAGCTTLQFGIEAADDARLERMDKRITVGEIELACRNATRAGLRVTGSMVIGIPGDDECDVAASFDFADYLQQEFGAMMVVGWFVPYPGTFYLENIEALGARIGPDLTYDTFNSLYPNVWMQDWTDARVDGFRRTYFDRVIQLMAKSELSSASDHYDLEALDQRNSVESLV